jgi:hypothetical protein
MRTLLFSLIVSIPILFSQCGQKEDPHELYSQADSMLGLTMQLQSRMGSPGIKRLHDFEDEIIFDLAVLSLLPEEDTTLAKYLELHNGLGQCMQACNQFHEETFFLESSLRDIMKEVELEGSDLQSLEDQLKFELENYMDLSVRIDSSIALAMRQAEIFYSLKPEIEKIKEQIEPIPE